MNTSDYATYSPGSIIMNINGFTGNGAMKSRLMIVSVEDICATAPLTLVPFFQNMEYTLGA